MGFGNIGKFIGDMAGFQMGGVMPPYKRSGVYDYNQTAEVNSKLLALFSSAIDALNKGDTQHFLSPEFDALLEESLVPLRAAYNTNRTAITESLARSGVTNPIAQQRFLEDMERGFGSSAAAAGRSNVGMKMNFMQSLLGMASQYVPGQQAGISNEHSQEISYDATRSLQRDARTQQQASTLRKYVMMMMGGGMGGMGGGMMGMMGGAGGGGFGGDIGGTGGGGMGNILGSEGGGTSGIFA